MNIIFTFQNLYFLRIGMKGSSNVLIFTSLCQTSIILTNMEEKSVLFCLFIDRIGDIVIILIIFALFEPL